MACMEIEKIKQWLEANLDNERYEHSLGTAECAAKLAKKFKLNEEKAYLAGLIHDCAKCLPKNECNEILCKLELCEGEFENCKTHHAPIGKYKATEIFGIDDNEILSAIRWHTLGRKDMTEFEKIIFLADKIESRTRPLEYTAPITKILEEENGLNKALLVCYKNTIKSLVDRNLKICTLTIEIYNSLL